jgi:hypothetical protein
VEKPDPGVRPIIVRGARGNAQQFGGFLEGHADKIPEFNQFSFGLVLGGELVERFVHGEAFVVVTRRGNFQSFQPHALQSPAVTLGALAAGLVNEDAAHGLGGGPEEMGAVGEVRFTVADQSQPDFIDESGGLECMTRHFIGHFGSGAFAQFSINQRQQFVGGLGGRLAARPRGYEDWADRLSLLLLSRSRQPELFNQTLSLGLACRRRLSEQGLGLFDQRLSSYPVPPNPAEIAAFEAGQVLVRRLGGFGKDLPGRVVLLQLVMRHRQHGQRVHMEVIIQSMFAGALVVSQALLHPIQRPCEVAVKARRLAERADNGDAILIVLPIIVAEVVYTLESFYGMARKEVAAKLLFFYGLAALKQPTPAESLTP